MRRIWISTLLLALAAGASGCSGANGSADASPLAMFHKSGPDVPSGTALDVQLATPLSSETAKPGDAWEGTTSSNVTVDGKVVVPAGTAVRGQVKAAREAEKGNRAMLDLELTSIETGGDWHDLTASTEPVIAGSPRARNLGAIAGGAAAGALIGKAVGGEGKDAAAGAIIGGAAATAGVAASKGYQVVLKTGTRLDFTVK